MTRIYDDPAMFAGDQLAGFCDLYSDRLRRVPGGVVSYRGEQPQVAVVIGGGSGHYPAFCGLVGPGLAAGAVVGNIFTSPSATQAHSVGRAADRGRGVIFGFGNYAGDNMNFGLAAERLRAEGIDTRIAVVTDDVASSQQLSQRRGIAGDFPVFKVMGAAAARGDGLDEAHRLGEAANAATRSLGVAFSGCTMPGSDEPLFTVPEGHLGHGLGIHGEPGIRDVPMLRAAELADLLVDNVLAAAPRTAGSRVGAVLNGLGTTKYEELFLLWSRVASRLREAGCEIVDPEVGELVTSLDMGGCSLTLIWLDEELEPLWRAETHTPAYRKLRSPLQDLQAPSAEELAGAEELAATPPATSAAQDLARRVRAGVPAVRQTVIDHEGELGRIDAVAGDGDHGRGMVKGITAAADRVAATTSEAGAGWLLQRAGQGWAEDAGGTSGALWGAALEALGRALGDDAHAYTASGLAAGMRAFTDTIIRLGKAQRGDKTLLDALLPFCEEFESQLDAGRELAPAWRAAAENATDAARNTADMRPRTGRALPLADKSVGTPDAGATSLALILNAVADQLTASSRGANS